MRGGGRMARSRIWVYRMMASCSLMPETVSKKGTMFGLGFPLMVEIRIDIRSTDHWVKMGSITCSVCYHSAIELMTVIIDVSVQSEGLSDI